MRKKDCWWIVWSLPKTDMGILGSFPRTFLILSAGLSHSSGSTAYSILYAGCSRPESRGTWPDFSIKKRHFSDTFLTTLSALKDPHIVKPLDPWYGGEISMASFTDNPFHHPAVWRKIYTRPSSRGPFHSHVGGSDVQSFNPDFTSEVFLNLVTSVYFPNENYSTSSRCTLMDAAVYISQGHLGHAALFFLDGCVLKPNENYERRLLFAIIRFSLHDEDHAQSTIHSHQPPFFDNVDFKRKLFRIAIHALNKIIHLPPFEFDREVFQTIGSYIALDLFPSWDFPEYNRLLWNMSAP